MNRDKIYPIDENINFKDILIKKLGKFPIYCPVCGKISYIKNIKVNFRESCICNICNSTNRNRQIAYIFLEYIRDKYKKNIYSLSQFSTSKIKLKILNTEASGPIHNALKKYRYYICSEYISDKIKSGTVQDGIMHQNLMNTSFENESLDVIISSDVFEHISDPYKAFREVFRILKPQGVHIFTAPFHHQSFQDDTRARYKNNKIILFKEPLYHLDPIRKEGILVYTIFSLEMLVKLSKIGFITIFYKLHNIYSGILGNNAIVFTSKKN